MQLLEQSNRFGVPAPKPGALPTGPHPGMLRIRRIQGVLYTMVFEKAITISPVAPRRSACYDGRKREDGMLWDGRKEWN